MRVAAVQMEAGVTDLEERRAAILASVETASRQGAEIVVLPELAVTGYGAAEAHMAPGEAETALAPFRAEADRLGTAIVIGLALATDTGTINAAALLAPGSTPLLYAKRMLYGGYEKELFVPGTAPSPIVTIAGLACGLLVCFDVEFPELCRDLARRGAQAILVPTALPKSAGAAFIAEHVVPVRAFENQVFVVYADHCGADARFEYQGQSVIAAPDGSRLASAGTEGPALLLADLDPAAYAESREQNPYLAEAAAAVL
ncbi:nitrilase-related carbon-nitrogen hydrolase [Aurantimonas sp. VKM B-3413]|uniref:nitrilase-related carbon-nitrogen hydrolase n=1 Tax=Aurantimonas sp. VKM B-3413 TaxID=2779401 RepID=UPI001E50CD14|nr:nitrilase-related carbon-nitrogen hydrolase [Aurantimonas sp. VKM B-3413]MCB8838362.1 hydrolase [Aurantimonas sp. VKM B-3413]